jgi:uncharacterized metal-binding protein
MGEEKDKLCGGSTNLIFACSGAADVGAVSDLAARKLTKEGTGKMYCLAGIGGDVEGIINTTKSADCLLAIDGCSVACTKKLLERNGFNEFKYFQVTDLGMEKGQSPANDANINKTVDKGKELLGV